MFSKTVTVSSTASCSGATERLRAALHAADAVLIGAGAGLSTSAGFAYSGPRFQRYFSDFEAKYGFHEMYSGGFCAFASPEEQWAFWSRYIFLNRYTDAPKPVYDTLFSLVQEKDYFVLTTNVDHCFQKAGFDKQRLFYTQGDYGLFQCSKPCHHSTYDNAETIRSMVLAQGYTIGETGELLPPADGQPLMRVPTELVPRCPVCHRPMSMNLRADDTFVQDSGWEQAARRYQAFLDAHRRGRVLYLELGVGYNTPGIIKYPFWRMTYQNPDATYACINFGQAEAPREIAKRSICIDGDIGGVLEAIFGNQ